MATTVSRAVSDVRDWATMSGKFNAAAPAARRVAMSVRMVAACHDPLQPAVLVLKLLQPLHLGWQQPCVSFLPVEAGRRTDPRLATDLRDGRAVLALLDDERLSRASVNFDAFIRFRSSPSQENLAENSSFKRSSLRAQLNP